MAPSLRSSPVNAESSGPSRDRIQKTEVAGDLTHALPFHTEELA